MKKKIYKAAIYLRLSKGDDDLDVIEKSESNSITNQRLIAQNYIDNHPDIRFVREYQDDGYTGMNFDRPGLKAMMEDIDAGLIDCIIVKDLSRFGRERIEAGTYLLKTFKEKKVRFISINDCYDSLTASSSETHIILPIKALTNDNYSRDISMKVRSSKAAKIKKGDYIGGLCPYGYKKNPDNKNALIIDEDAAEIVKEIFEKKIKGMSAYAIAEELTKEGVETPSEYKKRTIGVNSGYKRAVNGRWHARTVLNILRNESYTGTLIQGKTEKVSYKVNKVITKPEEEWVKTYNAMEPIVSRMDFNTVQRLLERDTICAPGSDISYIYSGLLFCGDCGSPMIRKIYKGKRGDKIYYQCSSYKKNSGCSNHRIADEDLEKIVWQHLTRMLSEYSDYKRVKRKLDVAEINFDEALAHDKKIADLSREKVYYDSLIRRLDVDKMDGLLDEEQFFEYKEIYEREQDRLSKAIESQKKIISMVYEEGINAGEKLDLLRQGLKIGKVERALIVTFIDKINVFDDNNIEILFRYQSVGEKMKELDRLSEEMIAAIDRKEA